MSDLRIIIHARDADGAYLALKSAINLIEADHQQCGYRYGDTTVFVQRNRASVTARAFDGP